MLESISMEKLLSHLGGILGRSIGNMSSNSVISCTKSYRGCKPTLANR